MSAALGVVLILASLGVVILLDADTTPRNLIPTLLLADGLICVYFWAEYAVGVYRAKDRKRYALHHLVDVAGAVPAITMLRWLRLFRLFRLLRVMRLGVSLSRLWQAYTRELALHPLATLGAYSGFLVFAGAACLYLAEHGANEKVTSYADALWLTLVTLTTVGYGDVYPVTGEGRVIGLVLAILGIGLLGSFTAAVASQIISEGQQNEAGS